MSTTATASPSKTTPTTELAEDAKTDSFPSEPAYDEIARLAYGYWLERGETHGTPEDDWFRAEQELRGGTVS